MRERVITYAKLFALLRKKKIKKKELQEMAGISGSTIRKLNEDKNVETNVLVKICNALECDICEIVDLEEKDD